MQKLDKQAIQNKTLLFYSLAACCLTVDGSMSSRTQKTRQRQQRLMLATMVLHDLQLLVLIVSAAGSRHCSTDPNWCQHVRPAVTL